MTKRGGRCPPYADARLGREVRIRHLPHPRFEKGMRWPFLRDVGQATYC